MTIEEIKNNAEELKRCQEDPVYFIEHYVMFDAKTPMRLKDSQKQQIRNICKMHGCDNDVVILNARYGKAVTAKAVNEYRKWLKTL